MERPASTTRVWRFGVFEVDAADCELRRGGKPVKMRAQCFRILVFLLEHSGEIVPRESLRGVLWPSDTFVDFDHSLNTAMMMLRDALGDSADTPLYIETLPKRGYRFIAPMTVVERGTPSISPVPSSGPASAPLRPGEGNAGAARTDDGIRVKVLGFEYGGADVEVAAPAEGLSNAESGYSASPALASPSSGAAKIAEHPVAYRKVWRILVPAVVLIAVTIAVAFYFRSRRTTDRLSEKDTIVLADFGNSTGDAIFDDTLKTALHVSLRQSPFLNILSDSKVTTTLQLMTRPASTKLTPEVARELCQRADSKAYVAGSIASLGSEYVLGLKAVNCQSGDTLAEEQVTASSKEKVLDALGTAASRLRTELGESLAMVKKFDVPLEEATTSSLEALKAYSLGHYERAIELDPNFATGYLAVGTKWTLSERGRAAEYITKAFQLRDHASEREKLTITAVYYSSVTGELDKAAQTFQEVIKSYPREAAPYDSLGGVYAQLGQYEKAAEVTRQSLALARGNAYSYSNLANYVLALQRFDEARHISHKALARFLEDRIARNALYAVAFLGADSTAMAEQEHWYRSEPCCENVGLALASDTEAYAGHLRKARELTKQSVASAIRAGDKESGAIWQENAALREAAYGNAAEARASAAAALKLAPGSQGAEAEAALALATAGDTARAESLAQNLEQRYPLDTQTQLLWLPAIEAQLALNRRDSTDALNALQAASSIELGQIMFLINTSCLYPVYIRGEAYLAAGQGSAAAAEFQKILDHSGIVWNCWTGALAHLGVARANALQARTSQGADADLAGTRALAAYKDFLALWKDADPDIPVLRQARAEYAKLQ